MSCNVPVDEKELYSASRAVLRGRDLFSVTVAPVEYDGNPRSYALSVLLLHDRSRLWIRFVAPGPSNVATRAIENAGSKRKGLRLNWNFVNVNHRSNLFPTTPSIPGSTGGIEAADNRAARGRSTPRDTSESPKCQKNSDRFREGLLFSPSLHCTRERRPLRAETPPSCPSLFFCHAFATCFTMQKAMVSGVSSIMKASRLKAPTPMTWPFMVYRIGACACQRSIRAFLFHCGAK